MGSRKTGQKPTKEDVVQKIEPKEDTVRACPAWHVSGQLTPQRAEEDACRASLLARSGAEDN